MTDNALADPPTAPTAAADPAAPPPAAPPAVEPPAADPPSADPSVADDDKGGDANMRIRGLLAENKAMREYSEHWRSMALTRAQQPAAAPVAEQPDPAPTLDKFDSTEKWAAAHAAWTDRQIEKRTATAVDARLAHAREQETQETVRTTYVDRLNEFEKKVPEARIVIANPTMTAALAKQPVIGEAIMASPLGPEIAHKLSLEPAELVRISRLPAAQAAKAIGRLEAQLESQLAAAPPPAAKPPKPPVSRAPAPPTPIDGSGSPSVDDMQLPLEDFLAKLNRKRK